MSGQAQGGTLDFRQNYQQQHGAPAPVFNPGPNYPAYPGGLRRNPLTTGQWLMIIGGGLMIGGVSYYGYVRYKQSKATQAAKTNPSQHLRPPMQPQPHIGYPRAA